MEGIEPSSTRLVGGWEIALLIIWEPGPKYIGKMTAYRHYYKNPGTTYFAILPECKIEEDVGVINNLIEDHEHWDPIVIL